MNKKPDEVERIATRTEHGERVVVFGREADALVERSVAVAFGARRCARVDGPSGCAVSFGGGTAQGQTAVSLLSSGGTALASRIAVALNHAGVAVGSVVGFADNLDSQAHGGKVAGYRKFKRPPGAAWRVGGGRESSGLRYASDACARDLG